MDEATIAGRAGLTVDDVRAALSGFASAEAGLVRMDRPIRDVAGGRHFHVASPARGTGTLEVNFEPAQDGRGPIVVVVIRPHWAGSWAGSAFIRLAEHLAREAGGPGVP